MKYKGIIRFAVLTALLQSALAFNTVYAVSIVIDVSPEIAVNNSSVKLGEIGEVSGANHQLVELFKGIALGRSPLPGRSLRLSKALLDSRIKQKVGKKHNYIINMPNSVLITRQAQIVTASEIEAHLLEHIEDRFSEGEAHTEIEITSRISDVKVPLGELFWNIKQNGRTINASPLSSYHMSIEQNGQVVWQGIFQVRKKIYKDVVQARRSINRNAIIGADDVELVRQDITRNTGDKYIYNLNEAIGRVAKRGLAAGEGLREGVVVKALDVKEGSAVTVIYQGKHFSLKSPAVVMIGASLGDFIPVKNLQSGKIIHGILTDADTVKID